MRSEVRILSGAMLIYTICSGPAATNGYLLICDKTSRAAIIDAPPESFDLLVSLIEELEAKPEFLLLTHSHWDHTADAAKLKEKYKIPLYIHALDAENVEKPGSDGLPLFFAIESAKVDHFLEEGQDLLLGDLNLKVIHTPGHTPGGVCFYIEDDQVLFSGDTLFQGSIGNLSFPTAEPDKMWESLDKLAKLPASTRVLPGHGEETTIGKEGWLAHAKEYFGG